MDSKRVLLWLRWTWSWKDWFYLRGPTVDGWNLANRVGLVVYRIIYEGLYIPGGCLGFLNHQQYVSKYVINSIFTSDIYHIIKLVMFEAGDTFRKKPIMFGTVGRNPAPLGM